MTNWLLHDNQKEIFEIVFAVVLTVAFVAATALLLWALGVTGLAVRLAWGFLVLWSATFVAAMLLGWVQRAFRVNLYDRFDVFLASNLLASCALQAGWAAFAAATLHSHLAGTAFWLAVVLHLLGGLSCIMAFFIVSSFYQGHIYRLVSLPLALVCFVIFSLWPRVLPGWLLAML